MAGVTAGELGVRAVLLERKHLPGRKLLMCGNNRCNLTSSKSVEEMVAAYGDPVGEFLRPALSAFPPRELRQWLSRQGLATTVHQDGRVFPRSEKADDVLHLFTDALRDAGVPLVVNSPVREVRAEEGGFRVVCSGLELRTPHLLMATGGVSYPKTGSVGDGQRYARALGHKVVPYRPGLAGFDLAESWLAVAPDASVPDCELRLVVDGETVASTAGEILFTRRGARGPAMVDASRIVARRRLRDFVFEVDLCPSLPAPELRGLVGQRLRPGVGVARALAGWLVPRHLSRDFVRNALELDPGARAAEGDDRLAGEVARRLKRWVLHPLKPRPLKEAMVTVGGVCLGEVACATMECVRRICTTT